MRLWRNWNFHTMSIRMEWCNHFGKEFGSFFKKLNMQLPDNPTIALLEKCICPREMKTYVHTKTCMQTFLYKTMQFYCNSQKLESAQMSFNRWMVKKETMAHPCHRIKEWTIDRCNLDDSSGNYANQKQNKKVPKRLYAIWFHLDNLL